MRRQAITAAVSTPRRCKNIYAVILVGGIGKRLKPLSKPSLPKPFLSVTKDNKTVFTKTIDRIKKIIPPQHIVIVTNKLQSQLVRNNFPKLLKENLLIEKVSRNTAPAIALAALMLKKRHQDATMIVLPADHYIGNEKIYLNTIKKGIDFVRDNPTALITIGLKPQFPATGYGYIKINQKAKGKRQKFIYKVDKFVEKPDLKTAEKFLKDGNYLWNAGAFIFKAATFLEAVRTFASDIYSLLKDMRRIDEKYRMLPNISVDYAVMEKADNMYCVKGAYQWEDIGSFDSLKKVLNKEGRRFVEKEGKVIKII